MKGKQLLTIVLALGLLLALAARPSLLSARPPADFNGDDYADLAVGKPGITSSPPANLSSGDWATIQELIR